MDGHVSYQCGQKIVFAKKIEGIHGNISKTFLKIRKKLLKKHGQHQFKTFFSIHEPGIIQSLVTIN